MRWIDPYDSPQQTHAPPPPPPFFFFFLYPLRSLGAEVTGLDPATANIDVARRHAAVDPLTQGIRYEAATVEEFIGAVCGFVPVWRCVGMRTYVRASMGIPIDRTCILFAAL
jgi:hypothetical protein